MRPRGAGEGAQPWAGPWRRHSSADLALRALRRCPVTVPANVPPPLHHLPLPLLRQMSEDMQQDAVDCASQALEKYNIEKDIAAYIKKEFDKKYNPTWHCIVGRNFGSYVTHETKHFIYFYLGQVAILLFKSG